MLKELVNQGMPLFNLKYYPAIDLATLRSISSSFDSAKLVVNQKTTIVELGNRSSFYKNVVVFYIRLLMEGEQHAVNLIQTLKKEYRLPDETPLEK
jgi:hypothetical protein